MNKMYFGLLTIELLLKIVFITVYKPWDFNFALVNLNLCKIVFDKQAFVIFNGTSNFVN